MRFWLLAVLLASCVSSSPIPSTIVDGEAALSPEQGAIGGLVLNASDGLPLSMVMIQAEVDGKVVADDMSDSEGNYRLPLAPGYYRITARYANGRVEYDGIAVHLQEQTDVGIRIDLRTGLDGFEVTQNNETGGTIVGIVLDRADGTVFPGTVVSLQAKHLRDVPMAITDEAGQFRFGNLKPGTYSLSCFYNLVKQGNVEIRRTNIKVLPGETTDVQLKLDLRIRYDG